MTFALDDFWFDTRHLTEFARLRAFIETDLPIEMQPFFKSVLAGAIRTFSYQDEGR